MRVRKLLIVGGGVGGMCLAIAMRQRGVPVELIDIDPDWRALGAGLTLNGATLRALARLGIAEAVAQAGHLHGGRRVHDSRGVLLADEPAYTPAVDDVAAWGGILRPRLHALLASEVLRLGCTVRLGLTVEALGQDGDDVNILFSDGTSGQYDVVVGADGIMSGMRRRIFPEAPAPRFTGQGCWRAVFKRPPGVEASHLFIDPGKKLGLNPVSQDEMYMFLLEAAPGNPWHDEAEWQQCLMSRLRDYGGLPHVLADEVDANSRVNYRPLETILLPPPWHKGRVVLIGDAVHATTPHAGFGAGLAIEDALLLSEYLEGEDDAEIALTGFAERRYPRCKAIIESSLALGALELAHAPASEQAKASADLFSISREPY